MKIAERIERLGTETAFAVSAEAAAFAAKGNKVYPFHLGDMNILTPTNVMEAAVKAMKEGKTGAGSTMFLAMVQFVNASVFRLPIPPPSE